MEIGSALALFFVLWQSLDIIYFELGKKGYLEKVVKIGFLKKKYDIFHARIKKIIHKRSFLTVLFTKISFGIAWAGIFYLGMHMKRKKFYIWSLLINVLFVILIYLIYWLLGSSLEAIFEKLRYVQIDFLVVIIAIIIFFFIEDKVSDKLEK